MIKAVLRGWRRMSLATRIVWTSLLLLLVVQAAGFALVRSFIADNARQRLTQELAVAERVWTRLLEHHAEKLLLGASVLAADYAFRDAISTGDVETVRSALENHGGRIGVRVAAYFDAGRSLVASVERSAGGVSADALNAMAAAFEDGTPKARVMRVGTLPFEFVMVPIKAPVVVGWVLMGFGLDQTLADDVLALTDTHLLIQVPHATAADARAARALVLTTLSGWNADHSPPPDAGGFWEADGQPMMTRAVRIAGWDPDIRVWLLRSEDEVIAPFLRLQALLLTVTVVGVLMFALGSWLNARWIARPLADLLAATRRLEAGDFETPVPAPDRRDEVGALSKAFDHMRLGIQRQQAEVTRLAFWDTLTGLPNRTQFVQRVQAALATGPGPASVVTLNLDRFKHVNDVLGYAVGDAVLFAVAKRLQGVLRGSGDTVARLGGDVFGLLIHPADQAVAVALADAVAAAFEEPLALQGQTVDVRAAMGVAVWPDHADTAELLLTRSEMAMHNAKARSSGLVVYSADIDSSSASSLSLLTELRAALEQGQLRLFLQPKVHVASGRVAAAEALVRWQHPARGLVPPMQFIPFAEQTGFIRQLTWWVLGEAVRRWHDLQRPTQPIRISVNLSTRDLLDQTFPARVAALLAQHDVPPSGICLEITESAIMDDPERAQATVEQLAAQGFKLSIDDFGTGYSSLAYLKSLPVDELKIDKSFVMGMIRHPSDATIVRSTIDLAHNLGLTVVAEGVEDAAILEALGALSCDEAQGYHISRPVPLEQFLAVCEQWDAGRGHGAPAATMGA